MQACPSRLTLLHLGNNRVADGGAEAVLAADLPELELLDLSLTEIPAGDRARLRRRFGGRLLPRGL